MRFIGDVHGKFQPYKTIIKGVDRSLQVGDMGVGFIGLNGGEFVTKTNPPYDAMSRGDHRYIRGNHDNPGACKSMKHWIPDGTMHNGIYCLGGAVSVDKAYRTQGLDWWEDEELSYVELYRMIDEFATIKPEIVMTHDCPEFVADAFLAHGNMRKFNDGSRTRPALQMMWERWKPRLWVFGHWHQDFVYRAYRTEFVCLNELSYMDVDLNDPKFTEVFPRGL